MNDTGAQGVDVTAPAPGGSRRSSGAQGVPLDRVVLALKHPARVRRMNGRTAHGLFPQLYYFTTKHWIAFSRTCPDPVLLELLVLHFYECYEEYVLRRPAGRNAPVAEHWRYHLRALGCAEGGRPLFPQLDLLFGIRAHTRFDLAEAICQAHDSYIRLYRHEPDMTILRSMIYGKCADRVFRDACLEFLAIRAASGRLVPSLCHRLAALFDWLWLPLFQWGRRRAWREAMHSIATGVPIRRPMTGPQPRVQPGGNAGA